MKNARTDTIKGLQSHKTNLNRECDVTHLDCTAHNELPPSWHGLVLQDIEAAIENGEESYQDWATVKKLLRKELVTPESIS